MKRQRVPMPNRAVRGGSNLISSLFSVIVSRAPHMPQVRRSDLLYLGVRFVRRLP